MNRGVQSDRYTDWWQWVQRHLDDLNWSYGDLARAAREYSNSVDESVISRWKTRQSVPEAPSVRAIAAAFGVDIREAVVMAGHFTEEELRAPVIRVRNDLRGVPDDVLLGEVEKRMQVRSRARARPRRRAATTGGGDATANVAGVDSVTISTDSDDADSEEMDSLTQPTT